MDTFDSTTTTTPTTPDRPPRPLARLSIHPHRNIPLNDFDQIEGLPETPLFSYTPTIPIRSSSSSSSSTFSSPRTPQTPVTPPGLTYDSRRKSTSTLSSIKRKPVPISLEEDYYRSERNNIESESSGVSDPFQNNTLNSPSLTTLVDDIPIPITPSAPYSHPPSPAKRSIPPRYILSADPPLPPPLSLPSSDLPGYQPFTPRHSDLECGTGLPSATGGRRFEDLPIYAEKVQTEPDTLAKKLWLWGFLCPPLWIIGSLILTIPLRATEPESDADRAQKLEEMIVILRQVEIKYGRRCLWSLLGLCLLIAAIVILVTVVSHGK